MKYKIFDVYIPESSIRESEKEFETLQDLKNYCEEEFGDVDIDNEPIEVTEDGFTVKGDEGFVKVVRID